MPNGPMPPQIGDYELLAEIGHDCDHSVYRARHVRLQRLVAIKVPSVGPYTPAERLEEYWREARVLAGVQPHPNIVPIREISECEGRPYIVMKLIEGGSLARHRPELVQDPCASAWLVAAVARAAHHVHGRGFLHLGLQPDHILLNEGGQPYLIGFGQARAVTAGTAKTGTPTVPVAPLYLAPERLSEHGSLTPATDVYSLGVTFYELLTGRPPFRGATVLETLLRVIEREPERPSSVNPGVEPDLEAVCLRCLRKAPRQRYESAAALADDLDRWLKGEPL